MGNSTGQMTQCLSQIIGKKIKRGGRNLSLRDSGKILAKYNV